MNESFDFRRQPIRRAARKPKPPVGLYVALFFGGIIAACAIAGGIIASNAKPPTVTVDRSEAAQKQRLDLIQHFIREGVIEKVETPGTTPRVIVLPAFYLVKFETKQTCASVIWCYYFDGSDPYESVNFYDSRSGKQIGYYTPLSGLTLD